MGRPIPLWLFLLCLLLGGLFTVFFGWSIKSTMDGNEDGTGFERLGKIAVTIASFPDEVRYSFSAISADPDTRLRVPRASSAALADFDQVRMKSDIHVQGLVVRADGAALARASGWRILVGAFVIGGELRHAAIALSPELAIEKVWVFTEEGIQGQKPRPTASKFIQGFAFLRDQSMIVAWSFSDSIQRFDRCGKKIWSTRGSFDHAVVPVDDEKFVWTLSNSEVVKLATATGEIVQRFSMDSISAANPQLDILGARRRDEHDILNNARNITDKWMPDPFHLNDVEPLPADIADRFEGFSAGDLLLSARSLNLVLVVDPKTLKVRWWQSGAWRRQHDPDWQPTGEITVYDNRLGRDYSQIVSIVPSSNSTRVVFDGRTNDFYSSVMGEHQITNAGTMLITSPRQGRVFEIGRNGRPVFEMFNNGPRSNEFSYVITKAIWLPSEAFDFSKDLPCAD